MAKNVNRTAKGWMAFDNWIFDKFGVSSGGQILDDKERYNRYLLAVEKEAHKYGYNKRRLIPERVVLQLEDENFHTLIQAFKDLGLIKRR
jgi:hypothetical protein